MPPPNIGLVIEILEKARAEAVLRRDAAQHARDGATSTLQNANDFIDILDFAIQDLSHP